MAKNPERDPRLVEFGARVRKLRNAAGLTQATVTKALIGRGVSVPSTALAKIETGTRPTTVLEAQALADVLRVPVGHLMRNEDDPRPDMDRWGGPAWRLAWRYEDAEKAAATLLRAAETYRHARRFLEEAADEYVETLERAEDVEAHEHYMSRLPVEPVEFLRERYGEHQEAPER